MPAEPVDLKQQLLQRLYSQFPQRISSVPGPHTTLVYVHLFGTTPQLINVWVGDTVTALLNRRMLATTLEVVPWEGHPGMYVARFFVE